MSSTRSVPPPSLQEVTRKLSVHSVKPTIKKPTLAAVPVSGTESDSDSVFSPDIIPPSPMGSTGTISGAHPAAAASAQPPLTSIAERRSQSGGEESEDDEDDEEGGWRSQDITVSQRGALDETVIKAGYLWKKGERRKTWKKRWFVLRPAHLAFYKTSAEYKLLRLLDLADVHSCTPVVLKKHQHTFGLVSPTRTFYLQAAAPDQVRDWVAAINDARHALLTTSTRNSASSPIPIPGTPAGHSQSQHAPRLSSSPSHSPNLHQLTSSDSDDASPNTKPAVVSPASGAGAGAVGEGSSPTKPVLSGYLMKCGSRRHNWHKRWFVLSGEKLIYSRSHMDTKPHRQMPLALIIDALEYDLPPHRGHPLPSSPPPASPSFAHAAQPDATSTSNSNSNSNSIFGTGAGAGSHTFKIVTTKRTLLLCAPSEEEEIQWLSAIRALIARRSGQGVVPGDPASVSVSPPAHAQSGVSTAAGTSPGSMGSTGGAIQRRRDSIVRRLSLSGGASPLIGGGGASQTGAGAGGAGGAPQEAASERQS